MDSMKLMVLGRWVNTEGKWGIRTDGGRGGSFVSQISLVCLVSLEVTIQIKWSVFS